MLRQILLLSLVLASCAPRVAQKEPEPAAGPPPDAVATWKGSGLSLAELDERLPEQRTPACRKVRRQAGGGGLEELIPCYREVAEGLALERLVAADFGDLDTAIETFLAEDVERRRRALIGAFERLLSEEVPEPTEAAVAAHYEAHREVYRRPGRVLLWNLFRRHDDTGDPEATMALLRRLRERAEAGESFGALAREYSHSETRLRDGLVGQLQEGRLPPKLEKIAFALGNGEISQPIPVPGGAILLQARGTTQGSALPLSDVGRQIRGQLRAEKVREQVETRRERQAIPAGSVVLEAEELVRILDDEDRQRVVLVIADEHLDVLQMRELGGLRPVDRAVDLASAERERLYAIYRRRVERQLLYLALLESDDPRDVELRQEVDEHLRGEVLAELVDRRLRAEMEADLTASPEKLRRYFDDNRALFQSPLRFELSVWDLPFGADPPRQLARMEELRQALSLQQLDLAAAVDELGGSLVDLGWRSLDELPRELPQKARELLLQTEVGSYSPAFQQDNALHMLWVRGRAEPRQLELAESAEEVREMYLGRFDQQLYREAVGKRLASVGFEFHEQTLRRLLGGGEL